MRRLQSSVEGNPSLSRELSASEAALYDRQIRLWGLEAQNRIRDSAVLIVGMGGLGAEVAKNLILAGPKSVTLLDEKDITGDDSLAQFMMPSQLPEKANRAEVSLEFCKKLNPLVDLSVVTTPLSDQPRSFYKKFDLILCLDQDFVVTSEASLICRQEGIAFIAGSVFGWAGYGFMDFTGRGFMVSKKKEIEMAELEVDLNDENETEESADNTKKVAVVTLESEEEEKTMMLFPFPTFSDAFDVNTKTLSRRLRNTVPRSFFLIKTLLKFNGFEDEALELEYRKQLETFSHYNASDENIFTEFRLFTGPQLGASCAIIGGLLSQEAIKAMSLQGEPFRNVLVYTPLDSAFVFLMPPK
uniref:ThiF domain-containing protein n=2 Tax=Bursaphelenchus xylophilus TaxID=6326 RepID=A0A1I7RU12_BURXY